MILREKKELTKMLILIEILHGKKKIKDLADTIGITIQGVSDYLKQLKNEGYIDSELKIKKEGFLFISEKTEELRDYISLLLNEVKIINITEAIAGEDIEKNSHVGLFMKKGYIYAYLKDSSSTGTALNSAKKGEDLSIGSLSGILSLSMGAIKIFTLPNSYEGGTKKIDKKSIDAVLKYKHDKIGVYGIVPLVTLKKYGINIDFEFGTTRSAIEAAHKGLNTIIFVSRDLLKYVIDDLEDISKGFDKVLYTVEDISIFHS
ncbi:MAG: winged helix-turn-helix transcriptional regulator [Thermoplasmata archaeon]